MKITILPSKAMGTVSAPPSKSMAHRLLIAAALSSGSYVQNVAYSEDILATLDCLEALGVSVHREENAVRLGGFNPATVPENAQLHCRESGSTLRFLIPLCLLIGKPITLFGSKRLMERPLTVYKDLCAAYGFTFEQTEDSVMVCGCLKSGKYTIPGDISSQFVTGLLFALSLVEGDSTLNIEGTFASKSYANLTVSALNRFGIAVKREDNCYTICGGQTYESTSIAIEGDYSNAVFLDAFNLLGGSVKVIGLSPESAQGDKVYQEFFQQLTTDTRQFDLTDCPDLGPVMFSMAAVCGGAIFTGIERLRLKECDRVAAMIEELGKFGVQSIVERDRLEILRSNLTAPTAALYGHNDHRIVMALSLLCSVYGGTIDGAEAAKKSFPDFFDNIRKLGIKMTCCD